MAAVILIGVKENEGRTEAIICIERIRWFGLVRNKEFWVYCREKPIPSTNGTYYTASGHFWQRLSDGIFADQNFAIRLSEFLRVSRNRELHGVSDETINPPRIEGNPTYALR